MSLRMNSRNSSKSYDANFFLSRYQLVGREIFLILKETPSYLAAFFNCSTELRCVVHDANKRYVSVQPTHCN